VRKSLQRAEPFHPRTSTREFVLYAPEYFEALLLPRLLDRMRSVAPEHSIQGRLRQQVVPSMVHRCMSYISAVGVLQSTNHMMVLPLQVAEFSAKGFDLRVVALPRDFTPFELCYLTHPNAQFDPAKQWLKSAIFEIAGDLTYTAQRSMHPQPPHRRSSMKRGRVVIRPEGTVAYTASPLESPSFYSRTFIP